MSRGALIALVVGLLVVVCCAAAVVLGAAGLIFYRAGAFDTPTRLPRPTRDPAATPAPAPTPAPAQLARMDEIASQVIVLRGLQPKDGVERKFLSTDEVRQRTLDEFNADTTPEEWRDSEITLQALGLIQPGTDLRDLLLRAYSEAVAGFYDPDTDELVVVSDRGALNAYDTVTYAHEYAHVLQDQTYDMRALGFSDEGWETDSERAAAIQALLEGDASLLEEQFKETLSRAELREYDETLNSLDVDIYGEMPAYLLRDFFFPYGQGAAFVRRYYDEGGWARVDEVWRDPPVSTEHILHPERYEAGDLPLAVPRPALTDTLGSGWRQADSGVMGEWYTYLILAYGTDERARLAEDQAARAAEGWGGDGYLVFHNQALDQSVLALHTLWDTASDQGEFIRAFEAYADERFGERFSEQQPGAGASCWIGPPINCLFSRGQATLWLQAPDPSALELVLSAYPEFE